MYKTMYGLWSHMKINRIIKVLNKVRNYIWNCKIIIKKYLKLFLWTLYEMTYKSKHTLRICSPRQAAHLILTEPSSRASRNTSSACSKHLRWLQGKVNVSTAVAWSQTVNVSTAVAWSQTVNVSTAVAWSQTVPSTLYCTQWETCLIKCYVDFCKNHQSCIG